MAKTKKRSSLEIQAFFRTNRWRRPQKTVFTGGCELFRRFIAAYLSLKKRKKKGRWPGIMPRPGRGP